MIEFGYDCDALRQISFIVPAACFQWPGFVFSFTSMIQEIIRCTNVQNARGEVPASLVSVLFAIETQKLQCDLGFQLPAAVCKTNSVK